MTITLLEISLFKNYKTYLKMICFCNIKLILKFKQEACYRLKIINLIQIKK